MFFFKNFFKNLNNLFFNNKVKKIFKESRQKHLWFIPNNSLWPFLISLNLFNVVIAFVAILSGYSSFFTYFFFFFSFINVIISMTFWFIDISNESAYLGNFTNKVELNASYGFLMFIASEGMFFISFFWAFFHFSLSPSIWCGTIWPSEGISYYILKEQYNTQFCNVYSFSNVGYFSIFPNYYNFNNSIKCVKFDLLKEINVFINTLGDSINFLDYYDYKYSYMAQRFFRKKAIVYKLIYNNPVSLFDLDFYKYQENMINIVFNSFNFNEVIGWISKVNEMMEYSEYITSKKIFKRKEEKEEDLYKDFIGGSFKEYGSTKIHYNIFNGGKLAHPFRVPALNTALLITSGFTVTASHINFKKKRFVKSYLWLIVTILLSFFFLYVQFEEYNSLALSINDSAYGSVFFLTTGFHGFHVIVGTIMLIVVFFKMYFNHFKRNKHVFFKCAIWYWHFVDGVWILLFISFYWWGTSFVFKKFDFYKVKQENSVVLNMNFEYLSWFLHISYIKSNLKILDLNFFDYNKNYLKRDPKHLKFMWCLLDSTLFNFIRLQVYGDSSYFTRVITNFKIISKYIFI